MASRATGPRAKETPPRKPQAGRKRRTNPKAQARPTTPTRPDRPTAKEDARAVKLPDGGELDRARDAYVAHIDAWIAEYDQAMVAPAGVVEIEPRVNRTFDEAVAAFGQAQLDADQEDRADELLAD